MPDPAYPDSELCVLVSPCPCTGYRPALRATRTLRRKATKAGNSAEQWWAAKLGGDVRGGPGNADVVVFERGAEKAIWLAMESKLGGVTVKQRNNLTEAAQHARGLRGAPISCVGNRDKEGTHNIISFTEEQFAKLLARLGYER
jgi:hypothetical protein